MRKVFGVFTLTVLLACSAHAGIMPNGDEPPPPPPVTDAPASESESDPADGNTGSGSATDSAAEISLHLVTSILSLF